MSTGLANCLYSISKSSSSLSFWSSFLSKIIESVVVVASSATVFCFVDFGGCVVDIFWKFPKHKRRGRTLVQIKIQIIIIIGFPIRFIIKNNSFCSIRSIVCGRFRFEIKYEFWGGVIIEFSISFVIKGNEWLGIIGDNVCGGVVVVDDIVIKFPFIGTSITGMMRMMFQIKYWRRRREYGRKVISIGGLSSKEMDGLESLTGILLLSMGGGIRSASRLKKRQNSDKITSILFNGRDWVENRDSVPSSSKEMGGCESFAGLLLSMSGGIRSMLRLKMRQN